MSYDIIVRFPNKETADEFTGQMSDGFGEGLCDFTRWRKKEGTTGTKNSDFYTVYDGDRQVWFVDSIFEF